MHTSASPACGRDDGGDDRRELCVCESSQSMKLKETRPYVNDKANKISNSMHLNFLFDHGLHGSMMGPFRHLSRL